MTSMLQGTLTFAVVSIAPDEVHCSIPRQFGRVVSSIMSLQMNYVSGVLFRIDMADIMIDNIQVIVM